MARTPTKRSADILKAKGGTPLRWRADAFTASGQDEFCRREYYFQIKTDLEQFLFYISPIMLFMPDMLPSIAEFICRAKLWNAYWKLRT
jgi:hypothetical protein